MSNDETVPVSQAAIALSHDAFQARAAVEDALDRLAQISEADRALVLRDGVLDRLFRLIAPPVAEDRHDGELAYGYFARHKAGLALIAELRLAIMHNYSIPASIDGVQVFIAPDAHQWFEDGVMFIQGEERFGGLLGLYRDGKVSFAVSARDAVRGEPLGPDDFVYVDVEELQRRVANQGNQQLEPQAALRDLRSLLGSGDEKESSYQAYLERYPWVLGGHYSAVQAHERFNDENIPDFSGVRLRDGSRDIIEIKSPSLVLFRVNGDFTADFSDAWHQIERYLDFARRDGDYLYRQKGIRFDNPHCYLIAGKDLSSEQLKRIRAKERMNPAITFLTYDDLLTLVVGMVGLIERLRRESPRVEA